MVFRNVRSSKMLDIKYCGCSTRRFLNAFVIALKSVVSFCAYIGRYSQLKGYIRMLLHPCYQLFQSLASIFVSANDRFLTFFD